jgi:hypothetical protein
MKPDACFTESGPFASPGIPAVQDSSAGGKVPQDARGNIPDPEEMTRQLDDLARVAAIMVDGDVCQRIVTADASDPNQQAFTQTKKTLMRLSLLASFPCDVNLWLPVPGKSDKVQIVIRNTNEFSQFWQSALREQDLIPPMKSVLQTGQRITVAEKPPWVSVLAAIHNSLGDIVGFVEVVGTKSPGCVSALA